MGNMLARQPPSPAEVAVLGDDDLLGVILLRVRFPSSLVRAALVCRRWYHVASDPALLRRFRELHPPAVLGFYCILAHRAPPRFLPLPAAPPELATAARHAGSAALADSLVIRDSRNGRLLVSSHGSSITGGGQGPRVLCPLQPARGGAVLPPAPSSEYTCPRFFLPEDGSESEVGGALAVEVKVYPVLEPNVTGTIFVAKLGILQSGTWTVRTCTTVVLGLVVPSCQVKTMLPPTRGKIFIKVSRSRYILELDLASTSVSAIRLPDAVDTENYALSYGKDSGLYLVHAAGCLLSIWRHESSGSGDWVLLDDAIRVREAYRRKQDVTVFAVDSGLEYVLLGVEKILVSMHLKSRAEKAYGAIIQPYLRDVKRIVPFMMIWPPVFPALSEENS